MCLLYCRLAKLSKTMLRVGLLTAEPKRVIIHACSNIVGMDGDCGRVHNDPTTKRVVDKLAKMLYNTHLATKETMQDELQIQKQHLDALMFKVQILLDEMGLDEVDTVQNAFNALACAVDEILN